MPSGRTAGMMDASIMDRRTAIAVLRTHEAEIRRMGVVSLALFGSTARGTAGERSDVDVLVELSPSVGYFELATIADRLSALLGRPVDVVPRGALKPVLRASVLSEMEVVLAA